MRCWGLCFHRKTKITSFQSTSSDILKDIKGCKETNSKPLHTNNIYKQPPEVFFKKKCSYKFHKIHRKTPVPESLF